MIKYSSHLNILDADTSAIKFIKEYYKNHKEVKFLDVGGRPSKNIIIRTIKNNVKYTILEINKKLKNSNIIHGDICNCPQISEGEYDIVFSNDVFEHIKKPWLAASECVRITKKNGLNIHLAPFSWRYHPDPIDCFRYTHTGLKLLFEQSNEMEELLTGYDISQRRKDIIVEGKLKVD
jgi:SAM-dependent methyltransferase